MNDILVETCVHLVAEKLTAPDWLQPGYTRTGLRHAARCSLLADWPRHWCLVLYLQAAHVLWSFVSSANQSVCRLAAVPEFCYLYILVPDFDRRLFDIY